MNDFDGAACRVLLVEDNADFRRLLKTVLAAIGVTMIAEAGDGTDALEVLKTFEADLVLLDWNMSPMDGLDFVRHIRTATDSPNPYLPIILVTGHTDADLIVKARNAGVNEFLAKPISAKSLLARIFSVLRNTHAFVKSDTYIGPDRRRRNRAFPGSDRRGAGAKNDSAAN